MGQLMMVPRDDGTGVLWVVDAVSRDLVGEAIPSDVYPGRWRAGVTDPRCGQSYVCVTGGGETLVDRSQRGTETFRSAQEAMRAIGRNRIV